MEEPTQAPAAAAPKKTKSPPLIEIKVSWCKSCGLCVDYCNQGVLEMNGNDMPDVVRVLEAAREPTGLPTAVIAHTLKGFGVSYMAGDYHWHMGVPTDEQFALAMQELGEEEGGDA